jgi:outer membrane lipopolysaccharide assembly protein LptE/RlpB
MPTRRDGLHAFAAMAASAALAGCGFELRRAPALPFRRMALSASPTRPRPPTNCAARCPTTSPSSTTRATPTSCSRR